MLIKLTNQVIDINLTNIKSIQKKSVWWDTGWTNEYILIEYKIGEECKINCDSKDEVNKDYNTIVGALCGDKIEGCEFCNGKNGCYLNKGLEVDLIDNALDFSYDACACGSFEDKLAINYCPMCGRKLGGIK